MSRRLALKNPQRDVCHSNPSSFNHLPTLCTQRRLGTPFSSTTSALFPVRRRGEECLFAIFQFRLSSFQSWSTKFRILQLVCFHTLLKTAGVGVFVPNLELSVSAPSARKLFGSSCQDLSPLLSANIREIRGSILLCLLLSTFCLSHSSHSRLSLFSTTSYSGSLQP